MIKSRNFRQWSAVLALGLGAASFTASILQAQDDAAVGATGKVAPAWTLKNLDGHDVSFAQFKGKVVVVDFWATWCPPCRDEIPGYIELQKKYGKDGLVVVGVSMDQKGPAHVKQFVEKNQMNYTIVMGDDSVVAAFGGFSAIPTTFLIDRQGHITHQKVGAWPHEQYEKLVKELL